MISEIYDKTAYEKDKKILKIEYNFIKTDISKSISLLIMKNDVQIIIKYFEQSILDLCSLATSISRISTELILKTYLCNNKINYMIIDSYMCPSKLRLVLLTFLKEAYDRILLIIERQYKIFKHY